MRRLLAPAYFVSLTILLLFGGGQLFARLDDVAGPGVDDRPSWGDILIRLLVPGIVSTGIGVYNFRRDARRFVFGNVLFMVWLPMSLAITEATLRSSTPAWPAQALHGVAPEVGRKAWAASLQSSDVGINSWGQRDRERSLQPANSVFRVAFIGDSFLEESARPVSYLTEQLLSRDDVEIVNLGVSSTQPDEYYYRLRSIAVPLNCRHCVVWLFSGNDFVDEPRTLPRGAGMFAVAPRPSWATALGLRSINHVLTNSNRPVLQAWFAAGDLAAQETAMFNSLREAPDDAIRHGLLHSNRLPSEEYERLKSRLTSPESSDFLAMLKQPDAGKFRSYYLTAGLWAASVGDGQWNKNPETSALYWARQMKYVCDQRSIQLTFVVIPEAFQVDSRMRDQWAPLADMRNLTKPCRDASERFTRSVREQGLDVLDLHSAFEDVPGTYLNLDGHWSDKGVELAAKTIIEHLNSKLPSR
ncbi:MAG: hypothetical protein U0936_18630 [Planctomycetaceae bacterium]